MTVPTMNVLFVCLGNICRSPLAEGLFRHRLDGAGLAQRVRLDSAGTGAWHVGEPPDPRAQAAAARLGADLAPLRARQFQPEDLHRFDVVLAMDRSNLDLLLQHAGAEGRVHLALPWLNLEGVDEVPDPYYGSQRDFEQVARLLDRAAQRFVQRLLANEP